MMILPSPSHVFQSHQRVLSAAIVWFALSVTLHAQIGKVWRQRTPFPTTDNLLSATATGAGLVALDGLGHAFLSATGDTWTTINTGDPDLRDVVWTGSQLVAVGTGTVGQSADGNVWMVDTGGFLPTAQLKAVAVSGTTWVTVGYDAAEEEVVAAYSMDNGASWGEGLLPVGAEALSAVARAGTQWVAVGEAGTIVTSPTAVTWTQKLSGTVENLNGIACKPAPGLLIVAVGDEGTILSSTNGTAWTPRGVGLVTGALSSIVWTGTSFVAVGGQDAWVSADGITWTRYATGSPQALRKVIWDSTQAQIVAVGDGGVVVSSDSVPSVQFMAADQAVFESDGMALVEARLTIAATAPVTVTLNTGGSAVSGTDYSGVPASVTFAAGETQKIVPVTLIGNTDVAAAKTLLLTLASPSGARLGTQTTHTITINDDDAPPPVSFTRAGTRAAEQAGTIGVEVRLGWTPSATVTVPLTLGGTTDTGDFTISTASLTFPAGGSVSQVFSAVLLDDSDVEPDETLTVTLGTPTNGTAGAISTFTLTVLDNDPNDQPGKLWELENPLPASEGSEAVAARGGGLQVIVGDHGMVFTSNFSGQLWKRRFTGSTTHYYDVVAGPLIMAIGDRGRIVSSTDGLAWTEQSVPGAGDMTFSAVARGAGTSFLVAGSVFDAALGADVPVAYTSPDGFRWFRRLLPSTAQGHARSAVWTGSQFVIVGGSTITNAITEISTSRPLILTSPDGVTWTDRSSKLTGVDLEKVIFAGSPTAPAAGDKLVAFNSSTKVYTSTDGITWTARSVGGLPISSGVWTGTQVLGVGEAIANSANGTSWSQHSSGTGTDFFEVAYTGSTYIAIGGSNVIMTSTDGINWNDISDGEDSAYPFRAVVWSGTQFVAVGGDPDRQNATMVSTSPDGTTWTHRNAPGSAALTDVAWSGTTFAAVGGQGVIMTSTNGTAWTLRSSGTQLDLHSVIWETGQFVAVGGHETGDAFTDVPGGAVVLTSPNGITWTRRTVPTAQPLEGVVFHANIFVAIGRGGEVITSPNAVNWIEQTSGITNAAFRCVASNGSKLVACTDDYRILTSTNGITWAPATSVPAAPDSLGNAGLFRVCWADTQFVAVGSDGSIVASPDGGTWTALPSNVGSPLKGIGWNGATLVAVGDMAAILSSGSGLLPTPSVQFDLASSACNEADGSVYLRLSLSAVPTATLSVPFLFTGSAAASGKFADVTVPASPIVFNPGETHKLLKIALNNDVEVEGDESLTITLQIAGLSAHALTIHDNDTAPGLSVVTQHQLLALGSPLTLGPVAPSGSGLVKTQWLKNGVVIPGATLPGYFVPVTKITDAGLYSVRISNPVNPVGLVFNIGEVGIADTAQHNVSLAANGKATFALAAAGNGLSYEWKKGGAAIMNPPTRITGVLSKTLVIGSATSADNDNYQCYVTQAASSTTLPASVYRLEVPTFTSLSLTLPDPLTAGHVGLYYSLPISNPLVGAVVNWSAKNLPKGLAINPTTGEIYGYPSEVITKTVTVTMTTGKISASDTASLSIAALPLGIAGAWTGVVEREPFVNDDLGSRIEITASSVGTYTGKLITGTVSTPFSGHLADQSTPMSPAENVVGDSVILYLPGYRWQTVDFSIHPTTRVMTGHVSRDQSVPITSATGATIGFTAWRAHATPADYKGLHTFSLNLTAPDIGNAAVAQGTGYGSVNPTVKGAYTAAGKLGDGIAYTCSGVIGKDGEVLLYSPLHGGKGTLCGAARMVLGGFAPAWVDSEIRAYGSLTWSRPATTSRTYPAGWASVPLDIAGSKYNAPGKLERVMALADTGLLPNASLTFTEGGLASTPPSPDIEVLIMPAGVVDVTTFDPLRDTTLSLTPGTGAFKGSFTMNDVMPDGDELTRTVNYEGLIVRRFNAGVPSYRGVGFFLLPQLPAANLSPMPKPDSTPIMAGGVLLSP